MKEEDRKKLLELWNVLEKDHRGNYKPTEATEKQLELILDLSKILDRRDASKLIRLLFILGEKKEKKVKPEDISHLSRERIAEEEKEIAVLYENGKTPTYEKLTEAEKQVEERKAKEKQKEEEEFREGLFSGFIK